MKLVLSFLLLLSFSVGCLAQQELSLISISSINGNKVDNVLNKFTETSDGYVMAYTTTSTVGNMVSGCDTQGKIVFIKYNLSGAIEWEKCYAGSSSGGYSFCIPVDDGLVMGGIATVNGSPRDVAITKLDNWDNIVWTKKYGGNSDEFIRDMVHTPDGGYLLLCESYSMDGDVGHHYGSQFLSDFWILKLDSEGNKVWSKVLGGSENEISSKIVPTPDGGCYFIGGTFSDDYDCIAQRTPGYGDMFVARLDSQGNLKWAKCLGGDKGGMGLAGCDDGQGGLVAFGFAGSGGGDVMNHKGMYDIWVVNLDSNGAILLSNCYGSPTSNEIPESVIRRGRQIWVAGASGSQGGDVYQAYGYGDAWIFSIDLDNNGRILKTKVLGGGREDYARIVLPIGNDMLLATGTYYSEVTDRWDFPHTYLGKQDIFIAKLATWPTSINDSRQGDTIKYQVYPTYTDEYVYIKRLSGRAVPYTLLDSQGGRILSGKAKQDMTTLNVSGLAPGMYLLQIGDKDTKKTINKIFIH